jgi:hypothetical protein
VVRPDGTDERRGPAEWDVDANLVYRVISQDQAEAIIGEGLLDPLHHPPTLVPTDPAASRPLGLRRDVDANRDHDACMMADWRLGWPTFCSMKRLIARVVDVRRSHERL